MTPMALNRHFFPKSNKMLLIMAIIIIFIICAYFRDDIFDMAFIFICCPSFSGIISPPLITVQRTPIMRDVFATSTIQIDSCFFGTFLVFNQLFFSLFLLYVMIRWSGYIRADQGFIFFLRKGFLLTQYLIIQSSIIIIGNAYN